MIGTRYPRPCPIPGHPQDEDEPALVTDSAWARLRAWHLHAPAERLPLPVVLTAWPLAWVLHAAHVPGHVVTYAAVAAAVVVLADVAPPRSAPPRTRGCSRPRPLWSRQRPAGGSPPLSRGGRSAGPGTC